MTARTNITSMKKFLITRPSDRGTTVADCPPPPPSTEQPGGADLQTVTASAFR